MSKKKELPVIKNCRIHVHEQTFGDDVVLCLISREAFDRWVMQEYKTEVHGRDDSFGSHIMLKQKNGKGYDCLIWMPSYNWAIQDQSVLAHELIHAVHSILSNRGVDMTEGCGEVFAYLFSYYFEELWAVLKRRWEARTKKKRKKHEKNKRSQVQRAKQRMRVQRKGSRKNTRRKSE